MSRADIVGTIAGDDTLFIAVKGQKEQRAVIKELHQLPTQLNVYKEALENEKQSIDLYRAHFKEAKTDADKELFEFLIKEEMNHHNILDEIVMALTSPEDWVESAEFGKRREY